MNYSFILTNENKTKKICLPNYSGIDFSAIFITLNIAAGSGFWLDFGSNFAIVIF